jgi:Na+/phosphate symporter
MLHYVVGGTLLTYISTNVLNTLAGSTIDTLYSSVSFVKNGTECNKVIDKVRKEIEKLDIKVKLELVKMLMDKLPQNDITKVIENGLIELMFEIKSVVDWIDYEIAKHQQKYLSGYRSINFEDKLDELRNLIFILDGRINLLMNVSNKT